MRNLDSVTMIRRHTGLFLAEDVIKVFHDLKEKNPEKCIKITMEAVEHPTESSAT